MFASDHTTLFCNSAVFQSYVMSSTDVFLATKFANRDSEFAKHVLHFHAHSQQFAT
jgi:hypothetical protein